MFLRSLHIYLLHVSVWEICIFIYSMYLVLLYSLLNVPEIYVWFSTLCSWYLCIFLDSMFLRSLYISQLYVPEIALYITLLYVPESSVYISTLWKKDWEYFLQYAHVAMQNHEARASRLRIYHLQGVPKTWDIIDKLNLSSSLINAACICKPNLLSH